MNTALQIMSDRNIQAPGEPPIIAVDSVSKVYTRVVERPSLRHDLKRLLTTLLRPGSTQRERLLALDRVSFTVQRGETLAIIGPNGAGKSTLLRLLSGISRPSEGEITVRGSFASLLSVEAGFIGERSGRENIYLVAAMYGVMPQRIDCLLDKIITFAELEDAIHQPVKHYSSGMKARLGFSIVMHIAPDLLFIDEVLTVGDSSFQEKCLTFLFELQRQNCSIIFVSHSAEMVLKLSQRAIWLDHGRQQMDGNAAEVMQHYQKAQSLQQ